MARDTFDQILTDTAAAEPAAPAVVDAAPATEPATTEAAPPAPTDAKPAPTVAMSRYNATVREKRQLETRLAERETALTQATERMAALEAQVAQVLAAQRPQAAATATATAEDTEDWIDQLLAAGAQIPPELAEHMRKQQERLDKLEAQVGGHGQVFQTVAERQEAAAFDTGMTRLQNACPNYSEQDLLEMLADGVKPARIVGWHDQIHGARRPAPAAAAPVRTGPTPTPVPQIGGTAGASQSTSPTRRTTRREDMEWFAAAASGRTTH